MYLHEGKVPSGLVGNLGYNSRIVPVGKRGTPGYQFIKGLRSSLNN